MINPILSPKPERLLFSILVDFLTSLHWIEAWSSHTNVSLLKTFFENIPHHIWNNWQFISQDQYNEDVGTQFQPTFSNISFADGSAGAEIGCLHPPSSSLYSYERLTARTSLERKSNGHSTLDQFPGGHN